VIGLPPSSRLPLIPDDEIAEVHSSGYCEDGKTFMLLLSTKDGKTICVQAEPGKALSVGLI
jgi:hypothetical protein